MSLREDRRVTRHKGMVVSLVLLGLLGAQLLCACSVRSIGDPGAPLFTVATLAEDAAVIDEPELGVAWRTGATHHFPAQRAGFDFDAIDVFEDPPADALVDESVARLDFFMGSFADLTRVANGAPPQRTLARSRAQLFFIHDGAAAPALLPAVAAAGVDAALAAAVPVVLVVDSGDPEARRCGDNVVADQLPGCAGCAFLDRAAADEPACCATLRADFDACEAVVLDDVASQTLPARVRVLSP